MEWPVEKKYNGFVCVCEYLVQNYEKFILGTRIFFYIKIPYYL